MWYKCLSEYLIKEGYINDPIFPCVFIKKSEIEFAIIAIYVNDMNLIRTHDELSKTVEYLNNEFEVKDLTSQFGPHRYPIYHVRMVARCST